MAWKCFYCGEEVEDINEIKCPYCGRRTLTKERSRVVKTIDTD